MLDSLFPTSFHKLLNYAFAFVMDKKAVKPFGVQVFNSFTYSYCSRKPNPALQHLYHGLTHSPLQWRA
jgi:hypothetical protein